MADKDLIAYLDKRIDKLEHKIDLLISFRVALITGAAVVSAIVSMLATYVLK